MKASDSIKAILPAMLNVQSQMKSLNKDRENPFANSKYVTLDNILDNLKPILTENNLILMQNPIAVSEGDKVRIGVETRVYHKDGEYFDYGEFLLDFEKGSKMNLAQSAGSLTSYAKRYALTAIFSIDTNEDTDGIYNQHRNNQRQPPQANQGQQITQPSKSEAIEKAKQLRMSISNLKKVPLDTVDGWLFSHFGVSDSSQLTDWNEVVLYLIRLESKAKEQLEEEQARQQQLKQQVQSGLNWEDANG